MTKLNMLLVDDEEGIIKSLRFLFRRMYTVTTATSGEEAWEMITSHEKEFHLVLSDQRMGGMQGHELLRKIHERDENMVSILLTGYTDMEGLIRAVNQGHIYAYVTKPWDPDELKHIVSRAAAQYELQMLNLKLMEELREINQDLEKRVDHSSRTS